MKKHLSFFLCLVFLALILVTAVAYNSKKPRVMILQSYEPEYAWTRDVDEGLNRIIRKWTGFSDRKCVVEGKQVFHCVSPGVRRLIKKKKHTQYERYRCRTDE